MDLISRPCSTSLSDPPGISHHSSRRSLSLDSLDYGTFAGAPPAETVAGSSSAGLASLAGSMLIFASSPPVFKLLLSWSSVFNACNVLCASNLVGLCFIVPYFWSDISLAALRSVSLVTWAWLVFGSVLYSGFGPLLMFSGLETTPVPTAAIIQRLESVLLLVASGPCLGFVPSRWDAVNGALTLAGALTTFLWPVLTTGSTRNLRFGRGELYILLSCFCYTASLVVTKSFLFSLPRGVLPVARGCLAVVFFHAIFVLRGQSMGEGPYTLELWRAMLWYGPLYVALGQMLWLNAMENTSPVVLSVGITSLFLLTLCWSAVLLREFPEPAEWGGSVLMLLSVLSTVWKELSLASSKANEEPEGTARAPETAAQ